MKDPVRVSIASQALPEGSVELYELEGREAIGELFEFDVGVACSDPHGLDEAEIVARPAELVFESMEVPVRRIFGMICAVKDVATAPEARHPAYRLKFVPRAWRMTLSTTSEVFLDSSVPEILKKKLERAGLQEHDDFELRLVGDYEKREFVLQYVESDLRFCSRLAEHLGISFFFEHKGGRDVIVFSDTNAGFRPVARPSTISFKPRDGHGRVSAIEGTMRAVPGRYVVKDYNYRTPGVALHAATAISGVGIGAVTEYGAHFKTLEEAERMVRIRAEEILATRWVLEGKSDAPVISAGATFELSGHPRRDGELLILEARHRTRQVTFLFGDVKDQTYANEFRAIPANTPYRPARVTPKPRVHGAVTGIVEAEQQGDYAELDEHGRYHVRFLFDTGDVAHGKASHLVRMAQPHAGPGYGFHFPLRDGVEVMLTFIDGDPDRPIITGAVPNPSTPSTVQDKNATRNVIRTGGGNEINIDDTEGAERIKLSTPHGNTFLQLGAPNTPGRGLVIQTAFNTTIGAGKDAELSASQRFKVKGGINFDAEAPWVDITGNTKCRIGGGMVEINSGGERIDRSATKHHIGTPAIYLHGSDVVQVVTGHFHVFSDEIVLKAGASTITITPGSIDLSSPLIKLNC